MMKSKGEASTLKDGVDMISNLSDDILHLILSRLPTTKEVVRTSILSTRWRYLWTSFSYSSLDLDFFRKLKYPTEFQVNKFKVFMDRVLVTKTLDLDSFRLSCSYYYYNMPTLERWIYAAIKRKVKLIHLMLYPRKDFRVPDCLVNSASLEVLRLNLSGRTIILPNFTRLLALRVLELNNVKLGKLGLVDEFLRSCPLLEDLSLINCWISFICISCPKLKNLRIDNPEVYRPMPGSVEISCPKLVFLEFVGYLDIPHPRRPLSLGISAHSDYELPDPEVDVSPLKPKTLEVTTTIDFLTKNALINLLEYYPDLESLHLTIIKGACWPCLYSNLDEDRLQILTKTLKRVEFVDFNEEKEKLFVVQSLLEYGLVLEEMVFSWVNEATYRERSMETMKEVSKLKGASLVKLTSLLKK